MAVNYLIVHDLSYRSWKDVLSVGFFDNNREKYSKLLNIPFYTTEFGDIFIKGLRITGGVLVFKIDDESRENSNFKTTVDWLKVFNETYPDKLIIYIDNYKTLQIMLPIELIEKLNEEYMRN